MITNINASKSIEEIIQWGKENSGNEAVYVEKLMESITVKIDFLLTKRLQELKDRNKILHTKLTNYVVKTVLHGRADRSDSILENANKRVEQLLDRADELLRKRDDLKTTPKERRKYVKDLNLILNEIKEIEDSLTEKSKKMEAEIEVLSNNIETATPIWEDIQAVNKIHKSVLKIKWAVNVKSATLRIIYFTFAMVTAIVIDAYTPFSEVLLEFLPADIRHKIVVAFLFIVQTTVFDSKYHQMKNQALWKLFNKLIIKLELFMMKLAKYEESIEQNEIQMQKIK